MTSIQDITNIDPIIRKIMGLDLYTQLKSNISIGIKTSLIIDFMVDTYGFFLNKEDDMEEIAFDLNVLTSIDDENFELSDDIITAIMGINQLVDNDDMVEDIKIDIKTLLVYLLEILQDNES